MSDKNSLIDETLDFNKSEQYKLSILISKSGLSFVILDTITKKIIAKKQHKISAIDNIKEYCYYISKILNVEDVLKYKYKKIYVIYQSFKSLIIPSDLYSEKHNEELFKVNIELDAVENLHENYIPRLNAYKLFAAPECILSLINDKLPDAQIFHQTVPIINNALALQADQAVIININKDFFDIHILKNKKLILDNSFKYKTKEDLLYYLLYTIEQLNLNSKEVNLLMYLSLEDHKEMKLFLSQYFVNINKIELPKNYTNSYLFPKELIQQYSAQIQVFECE